MLRWQRWQRYGCLATSILSWFEPCGLWQLRQFSRTGACSQRKGPRFSVWHWRQSSFVNSALIILGLLPSWGLWQLVQVMRPSRTGWCEVRRLRARIAWWQVKQVSESVVVLSWARADLNSWTPWQVMQATPRRS